MVAKGGSGKVVAGTVVIDDSFHQEQRLVKLKAFGECVRAYIEKNGYLPKEQYCIDLTTALNTAEIELK